MLMVPLWLCVGFANGAVVKWPFMNKITVHPHLMAFNAPQERAAGEPQV